MMLEEEEEEEEEEEQQQQEQEQESLYRKHDFLGLPVAFVGFNVLTRHIFPPCVVL
jgi:hypothetical protein